MSGQDEDLAVQFDVRSVTVTWVGDDEFPEVEFEGCSQYEAWGMCAAAVRKLERVCDLPDDEEDEDDD